MRRLLPLVTAFIALFVPFRLAHADVPPDVIFVNGRFVTLDARASTATAVAVKNGRFVSVGDAVDVKRLAGPATRVVDLGGRLVVPGLIDGHTHPLETVRMKETYVDARYPGVPSVKQALANIAARAKTTAKGAWIFVAASSSSENKYVEKRLPSKTELDKAAPINPVAFLNGTHGLVTNSLALQRFGIRKGHTRLPRGGLAIVDKRGEPTGEFVEAEGDIPDDPSAQDLFRYYSSDIEALWNQHGFTSVVAITNANVLPVLNKVATSRSAPHKLRFTVPLWTDPAGNMLPKNLATLTVDTKADPAWFRNGGIKCWVDGEVDARTGALYQPYLGHYAGDFPGGKGALNLPQAQASRRAASVDAAGRVCLFHCSADHSMDIALTAYESVIKSGKPRNIMRIEHFGMFMLDDKQLKRCVAAGIKVSVQPAWMTTLAASNRENLGGARADTAFRFRAMIDAGLEPAAGTDTTGIYLVTLNPFLHMWAAVTRNTDVGILAPEQAVTVLEALKMWTIWPAKAMGEEKVKGTIEVGKYADMTVLSDDIFSIAPERLKDVRPVRTIVGGATVYQAK